MWTLVIKEYFPRLGDPERWWMEYRDGVGLTLVSSGIWLSNSVHIEDLTIIFPKLRRLFIYFSRNAIKAIFTFFF